MRSRRILRRLPLAAALIATLAAALPAAAQAADRLPRCHDRRAIAKYLGLSKDQATQWRAFTRELYETTEPLREQIEPLVNALQDLLAGAAPAPAEVGQVVVDIDALRDEIRAARAEFEADFTAILTPAQLLRWEALRARCGPGDED
jgi:Spy/CpxP family protein refolding chaperone